MRIALSLLLLIISYTSYSQALPSDYMILKEIYGKVDETDSSYTRPLPEGEYADDGHVTYSVVYKALANLTKKDVLVVVVKAPTFFLHGHRYGFEDFYFFERQSKRYVLIDSIISENDCAIGDENDYTIIEIGKGKKALVSTFLTTGNHHLKIEKRFYLLQTGEFGPLLGIDLEYSNWAWKIPEDETADCDAERYLCTFEFVKSDKMWYDIHVHRVNYGFTKGCKDDYIDKETNLIYVYQDNKYVERNLR